MILEIDLFFLEHILFFLTFNFILGVELINNVVIVSGEQ